MSASFSGSEVSIHSPRRSSLENVEMSEAKSLTGQEERLTHTKSCDVHTGLLGRPDDLADNNAANQAGVAKEEANVNLERKLVNLGINNQSYMDLAHQQMEVNDENREQCTSLAELSFRIDSPGDLGSEFRNLDSSMNSLFGKGTERQANFGANNFASKGQVDMLVLQCKSEVSLKKNIPTVNSTPFAHIDERMVRILSNEGAVNSDLVVYTPDCDNVVGRVEYANAECIDEKPMKIGGIEVRKSSLSMQSNEPRIRSLLKRGGQSQVISPRRNYEPAEAGIELERSITYPRASQVQKVFQAQTRAKEEVDYEDLYLPQGTLPYQRHNYKTPFYLSDHQKVSCLEEEELYPVLMNGKLAQRQGFVGSSFPFQNDVYSDGADLNKAVKEHIPYRVSSSHLSSAKAHRLQNFNAGAEEHFIDQFDYSSVCFAGPHEHPHARFQNFRCHSNEQYSVDPYYPRLPSSSGVCVLPTALHQFTGPTFAYQKDISPPVSLNSAPNANTCYKEHACMQLPSHMHNSGRLHPCAPTFAQHAYQPWHTEDQYLQHTPYGRCSRSLPQRGLHRQQLHGGAGPISQSQTHACLARKENCPPLPGPRAPPYVLCQGCDKILQVPAILHNKSVLQRIRCGACGRTSKFCNVLHPYAQALLENGLATGSTQTAYGSPFMNKHRSHSIPARMGVSEQDFTYDGRKVPMPAALDRNLRSSCGFVGQHDRVDKHFNTQASATPVSSYDAEKLDAFCHPRLTTTMLLEQQPCESEWRYGTAYRLPGSSGKVCENYPSTLPFIAKGSGVLKNAAGNSSHKMQQFKARVDSVSPYAKRGQGKEAFEAPRFADDFIHEQSDSRVRVSSGEIQGLSLVCPQKSSSNGSPLIEHIDSLSLQQGHGNAGVVSNGANGASCSPGPGSPLHEHLSHDAASESAEWACKQEEKGKQADAEPSVQEVSKGSKFLSGLLKKNIREFGRGQGSNRNEKVVVNGQMLPYAAVKSAEKQAGTIRPGIYWYDYQAGFWGVMGGPCLGIIPPSIAEFNFPLAKECAGGTTGVFVNGRELHKKDLDALAGRGLPKTRGKAYMVDISGQVIDQASGQLLRSLGRLAPTIERRGRGCGMFQPPTQS